MFMRKIKWIVIIIAIIFIPKSQSIIGYDCKVNNLNITTVSLLQVGTCDLPINKPIVENIEIQLLQLTDFMSTEVFQCKIEIDRTIYYCGMYSHISVVNNGRREYIQETTKEQCQKIHNTRTMQMTLGNIIVGLPMNATSNYPITLAGKIGNDGSCKGVQYSDPYGSWSDVIVQANVKISVYNFNAVVHLNENRISMPSGLTCHLNEGSCMDFDKGNSFWTTSPPDDCQYSHYTVLFEGKASHIQENNSAIKRSSREIYMLDHGSFTFALAKKGERKICGYTLIETEHPKLFILETRKDGTFARKGPLDTNNLDFVTYVNSKFIFMEKHMNQQFSTLYHDILVQRCLLQRQVLENALMLGITSPDEFANTIMKKPGYMTVSGGEVIFLIKCIPVEVKIRRTERCYQQLAVYKGNDSYFITPRTHMLIRTGTEIDCNDIVAPMYYINNIWYKFTPNPQRAIEPMILKPDTEPTWEYQSIDVGSSGIYSDQEMEKLRKHIMFPAEKPAVLSNVARGVTGQTMEKQGMSISYLLDEETINTIVKDTWKKTWGWFTGFGTFSAGLLGIWMVVKFLKFVIDTILHGIALHTIYGWSLWLIGAIWDSLTSFLLHLGQRKYTDGMTGPTANTKIPDENEEKNLEMGPPSAPQLSSTEQRLSNQTQPQIQTQPNVLYPSLKNESGQQPNEQPKVIYVHMDEN